MQFDPTIHTKEFLLSNPDVAFDLAENSSEFAVSNFANDFDILKIAIKNGWTVAHRLARCQSEWVHSDAAKSFEILKLANIDGLTVAHEFANSQSQTEWIHSQAAKSFEILKLANIDGLTIAHRLAHCRLEWIHSEAAKNLEILKENSKFGSVALYIAKNNENCIHHEPLLNKQILTLEHLGKSLAEEISEKYKSKGFDVAVMAVKLISQGAAYKHSVPIYFVDGEAILNQSKALIEDSSEPLIALKQLQALYSTFSHNVNKVISTQDQKSLQKWQGLLLQSENLMRQHLNKHPDLYDIEHTIDIHCEPGDDLLKKIQSERILASDLTSLSGLNNTSCSEQEPKIKNLY